MWNDDEIYAEAYIKISKASQRLKDTPTLRKYCTLFSMLSHIWADVYETESGEEIYFYYDGLNELRNGINETQFDDKFFEAYQLNKVSSITLFRYKKILLKFIDWLDGKEPEISNREKTLFTLLKMYLTLRNRNEEYELFQNRFAISGRTFYRYLSVLDHHFNHYENWWILVRVKDPLSNYYKIYDRETFEKGFIC